ncbi:unnamed protein product [Owenia fusiformis]|uniref:Uncharacterized protein n=1 Tax=Owenia fusiformis TaxID=6347 RepID=A0A8J1U7T6_OWEFU|nr:unnamed protein product [Owenia fusiformis]
MTMADSVEELFKQNLDVQVKDRKKKQCTVTLLKYKSAIPQDRNPRKHKLKIVAEKKKKIIFEENISTSNFYGYFNGQQQLKKNTFLGRSKKGTIFPFLAVFIGKQNSGQPVSNASLSDVSTVIFSGKADAKGTAEKLIQLRSCFKSELNTKEHWTMDFMRLSNEASKCDYETKSLHITQDYLTLANVHPLAFEKRWIWGETTGEITNEGPGNLKLAIKAKHLEEVTYKLRFKEDASGEVIQKLRDRLQPVNRSQRRQPAPLDKNNQAEKPRTPSNCYKTPPSSPTHNLSFPGLASPYDQSVHQEDQSYYSDSSSTETDELTMTKAQSLNDILAELDEIDDPIHKSPKTLKREDVSLDPPNLHLHIPSTSPGLGRKPIASPRSTPSLNGATPILSPLDASPPLPPPLNKDIGLPDDPPPIFGKKDTHKQVWKRNMSKKPARYTQSIDHWYENFPHVKKVALPPNCGKKLNDPSYINIPVSPHHKEHESLKTSLSLEVPPPIPKTKESKKCNTWAKGSTNTSEQDSTHISPNELEEFFIVQSDDGDEEIADITRTIQNLLDNKPPERPDTLRLNYKQNEAMVQLSYQPNNQITRDWKDVATCIGLLFHEIGLIAAFCESKRSFKPTDLVLRHWQYMHNRKVKLGYSLDSDDFIPCTQDTLEQILEEIDRHDIKEIFVKNRDKQI